jgi:hypothetical protein
MIVLLTFNVPAVALPAMNRPPSTAGSAAHRQLNSELCLLF